MSHEVENYGDVAYQAGTPKPWHDMADPIQFTGQLPKCLDWLVQPRDLLISENGHTRPSVFKSFVRSDTGAELGVATAQYHPHQNQELWNTFVDFCSAGNMQIETAGALKGGKLIWILAKIDKSFSLTSASGSDKNDLYALIATAHDTTMRTVCRATIVRVVCWNTLTAAIDNFENDEKTFKATHRGSFNKDRAKDFVATAILGFEKYQQDAEKLISVKLNGFNAPVAAGFVTELLEPDQFKKSAQEAGLINISADIGKIEHAQLIQALAKNDDRSKVFIESVKKELTRPMKQLSADIMTEQEGIAGKSVWSLLQGTTRYIDHTHGRTADSRLSNAWFGQGNALKSQALGLATDYASALS
jgi:phage/plasmid-like protein (TIGR03299 family)